MNITELIRVSLEDSHSFRLDELEKQVAETVARRNEEGYKVISMTPLTGSNAESNTESYCFGVSFTIGMLITFEK